MNTNMALSLFNFSNSHPLNTADIDYAYQPLAHSISQLALSHQGSIPNQVFTPSNSVKNQAVMHSNEEKKQELNVVNNNINGEFARIASGHSHMNHGKKNDNRNKIGVTTHYFWRSGHFTTTKNNNCLDVKRTCCAEMCFGDSSVMPSMRVIEPITMENVNVLSYYNDFKQLNAKRKTGGSKKKNSMPTFKDYIFFSKRCTMTLQRMIDQDNTLIDSNRLYQFESRYFQYSLLQGKMTFVQTAVDDSSIINNGIINNNDNNSGSNNHFIQKRKEYLIFRFGHGSKFADKSALFGVCQRNRTIDESHPNYQPWQCVDIVAESNILRYFNLDHCSEDSRLDFLSYLPKPLDCHQQQFKTHLEFDGNFNKITKILSKGCNKYQKDKKQHEMQQLQQMQQMQQLQYMQQMQEKQQKQQLQHLQQLQQYQSFQQMQQMEQMQQMQQMQQLQQMAASNMLPTTRPMMTNTSSGASSNNSAVNGYNSDNSANSVGSFGSRSSYRSFSSVGSNKSSKLKNEDKFRYLYNICGQMGITFEQLVDIIMKSIAEAFEFAKKYPTTVLTQAYIDEERQQVFYEPVLLGEIKDNRTKRVYKFAVPVVESKNKKGTNGLPMYVAKNILTPQMTIENVTLNTPHICYDPQSWVARMYDYQSFYHLQKMSNEMKEKSPQQSSKNKNKYGPPVFPIHNNSRKSIEIS